MKVSKEVRLDGGEVIGLPVIADQLERMWVEMLVALADRCVHMGWNRACRRLGMVAVCLYSDLYFVLRWRACYGIVLH